MREILFRGKRTDTDEKEWTYGHYYKIPNFTQDDTDRHVIVSINNGRGATLFHNPVKEETIGQYTGRKDKNDKKIFEGDIVITRYSNGYNPTPDEKGVITWIEDEAEWEIKYKFMYTTLGSCYSKELEIIGNIYDNPELKGGK